MYTQPRIAWKQAVSRAITKAMLTMTGSGHDLPNLAHSSNASSEPRLPTGSNAGSGAEARVNDPCGTFSGRGLSHLLAGNTRQ